MSVLTNKIKVIYNSLDCLDEDENNLIFYILNNHLLYLEPDETQWNDIILFLKHINYQKEQRNKAILDIIY